MDREKLLAYINKYHEHKQRAWNSKTAKTNAYYFKLLKDYLDVPLTRETLLGFFNHLYTAKLSESTRHQAETAIISFTRWLHNEGFSTQNYGANIERTKIHRKTRILPSQEEVLKLINQATSPGKYDNKLTTFSK